MSLAEIAAAFPCRWTNSTRPVPDAENLADHRRLGHAGRVQSPEQFVGRRLAGPRSAARRKFAGRSTDRAWPAARCRRRPGSRPTIRDSARPPRRRFPRPDIPARRAAREDRPRRFRRPPCSPRPSRPGGPSVRSPSRRCRRGRRTRSSVSRRVRLSAAIDRAAASSPSAGALPICAAKARMPVPSGLVRISRSPGRAPALVTILSGWISPVTAKPALISLSLMLCPPTTATPASAILSMPPRRISCRTSSGTVWMGKPTIESAVIGRPPMAYTSLKRVGRRDLPEHVGSSTDGEKTSTVCTSARSSSSRYTPASSPAGADEHARIVEERQPLEHAVERRLVDLRGTARALDHAHQPHRPGAFRRAARRRRTDVLSPGRHRKGRLLWHCRCSVPAASSVAMTRLRFSKSFMRHHGQGRCSPSQFYGLSGSSASERTFCFCRGYNPLAEDTPVRLECCERVRWYLQPSYLALTTGAMVMKRFLSWRCCSWPVP